MIKDSHMVDIALAAKTCGLDAIYFDLQHSAIPENVVTEVSSTAVQAGIASIVRIPEQTYIRTALEEGAELLTGGPEAPEGFARGYFVKETVLGRVQPNATVAQEEVFGPVLSIIAYRDDEDAVRIANDSIYGLAGAVCEVKAIQLKTK